MAEADPQRRVLVAAPTGGDAEVLCRILGDAGIEAAVCRQPDDLCRQIDAGAAAAILAEESLAGDHRSMVSETLARQPEWSDFPLIVMGAGGEPCGRDWRLLSEIRGSANVVLLQRPVRRATLLSSVRTAIQSRLRQYQIRDELAQRRLAEAALRESTRRFQTMADTAPAMLWVSDRRNRCTFLSRGWYEFTGLTEAEGLGDGWLRSVHPDDRARVERSFRAAAACRQPFRVDHRLRGADGEFRWTIDAGRPRLSDSGEFLGYIGSVIDVHERKQAEQALQASEQRLADELDVMTRLHELVDRMLVCPDVPTALEEVLGATIEITRADMGTIQLVDPASGALEIVAQRGFRQDLLGALRTVSVDDDAACGCAIRRGERSVIEDVNEDPGYEEHREIAASAGYRAMQATPLLSRHRQVLGVLSTYHVRPSRPSPHDLRVLDLYARQAADFIERKRNEEALRESERRLATLVSNLPGMAYRCRNDANWTVEFASEGVADITGYSASDLARGRFKWSQIQHPEDAPAVREAVQAAVEERRPYRLEYRIRHRDGSVRWVWEQGEAVFAGRDELLALEGFVLDITERKQAEWALRESEERFRELANHIHQFAWTADRFGYTYWYNERWYEYTGTTPEEMKGWGWQKVHHPDHVNRVTERLQRAYDSGEPWEDVFPLRGKDGTYRWFLSRAQPIRDERGRVVRWFGTNTDVTEQRKAELALQERGERLRQLNESLEQRVAQRTEQLRKNNVRLRRLASQLTEAEQRERQKLAKTLHDGLQQILVAGKMQLPACRAGRGEQAVSRLEKLLDEAINASRSLSYELSPPALQASDLPEALQWLARWFRANHHFDVELEVDESFPGVADQVKTFLFHTVRELLFNSVKHSGVKSATVGLRMRRPRRVSIIVADRGRGFDPAELDLGDDELHGFGLFSIRERLAAMGGTFRADARPGQGATFHLSIPVKAERAAPSPAGVSAGTAKAGAVIRQAGGPLRVMIADDHSIVREGLGSFIAHQQGLELVGEAGDGEEAVQQAERLQPDIVLMDVDMPRMSGIEATRLIKLKRPETMVVALSFHEEREVAEAMRRAGASAFVRKGSDTDALLETIRGLRPATAS